MERAWLIFREGKHKLRWFLKKDFGHVNCLIRDQYNWIILNPADSKLEIEVLPYSVDEDIPQRLANLGDRIILEVEYQLTKKRPAFARFSIGFTCVTLVKYYLGMRTFVFTPFQLYKKLLYNKRTKGIIVEQVHKLDKDFS